MNYSDDLVQQLDGLGIDMSISPDNTRQQIEDYYDYTKDNVFGYIEDLTEFNKVFEPVYGVEYFILVKEVYSRFMEEYNRYLDRDKRARADETNTKRKLPTESRTKSKTKVKTKAKSLPDIRDKFKGRGAKSNAVRDKKGFAVRDKSGKAVKRQQNKPKKVGSLFRKKD